MLDTLLKGKKTYRAVTHKLRLKAIKKMQEEGRVSVGQFYKDRDRIFSEQSVASQHLSILRKAGIVEVEKDGKFRYYSISPKGAELLKSLVDFADTL